MMNILQNHGYNQQVEPVPHPREDQPSSWSDRSVLGHDLDELRLNRRLLINKARQDQQLEKNLDQIDRKFLEERKAQKAAKRAAIFPASLTERKSSDANA